MAQVQSFNDLTDKRIIQRFSAARDGDYQRLLRKLKSKPTAQHVRAVRRKLLEVSASMSRRPRWPQARWLALSSNSKQIFARNSSEYIQFDEPETVINAIREVYDQTKKP